MYDYNRKARMYSWSITAIGYLLLLHATFVVAAFEKPVLPQILIGAGLTSFVSFFQMHVPRAKIALLGGEIFSFLTL